MFAEERLLRIVELVNRHGKVTVTQLSEALGVSPVTVRRDLERLETDRHLLRTHGGAMAPERRLRQAAAEKSFSEKEEAFAAEKERIAQAAARLVNDGEAILLTPGTTNMMLARLLDDKEHLTVVTNAVNIAAHISGRSGWDVVLTGGNMRQKSFALIGPLAERSLADVRVDKLFLGVDGIDFKEGLTTPNLAEASVNRLMIGIAKQVIVVADRSKFGRVSFGRIADIDRIHAIVSDRGLDPADAGRLSEKGIEVLLA